MKINFITTESLKDYSGGWSGNSYNIFTHLDQKKDVTLQYIGPVKPAVSKIAKIISKSKRVAGLNSKFYYFSDKRLNRTSKLIEKEAGTQQADYTFFMGVTHWLKYIPDTPYGAYLDASFRTYFENNIKTSDFSRKDIARIETMEKQWLENATHVFWASEWAKNEAIRQYNLSVDNHYVVGIGGNLSFPDQTGYNGDLNFLLIAQDFFLKGGDMAFAAFEEVYGKYPEAKFYILGQKPPEYVMNHPGVIYPGYLHKNNPKENALFLKILSEAFCLIHATKSDTIAQVIIECGYFGCPSIAPARFAIPELIVPDQTGILLPKDFAVADISNAMFCLIDQKEIYRSMRESVRKYHQRKYTYEAVTNNILGEIL